MEVPGFNSSVLLLFVLIGAFFTTCIHHLFTYITNREQKISLIFAVWIFVGLNHHALELGNFIDSLNFPDRHQYIKAIILVESYISTSMLLYLVYGNIRRYQEFLIPIIALPILGGLMFPEVQTALHVAARFLLLLAKIYLLYRLWLEKRPGFGLLIGASVLFTTTIIFFGSGPISIKEDYPLTSQLMVILSYVISINLYSAYLGRLAAQASLKLIETETTARNLQEIDQLKTRFFSNITHEFRTPLTLIQGPAKSLEQSAPNSETRELIGIIRRNTDRLLKLINQLLDLAKFDAHQMSLLPNPVDLEQLIRATYAQFSSAAKAKGLEFLLQIPIKLPVVSADSEKLESIIFNLLSNAIKFTGEGGRVVLRATYESGKLSVYVMDTGRGIEPQKLERIFDRFYQVNPTDASHSEGTGIGLALVKEYVELMQGLIRVESQLHEGTRFFIELPLPLTLQRPSAALADSPGAKEPFTEGSTESNLPTILLVDDNEDIRTFIRHCLGSEYRYLEAGDGKSGLSIAQQEVPDVLICDWMMPGMDGIEFCGRIKSDRRTDHIPFIMLTAKATRDNRLEGLQTGADDYLVKPFDREELVLKVQNLLNTRENLQAYIRRTQLAEATPVLARSTEEKFITQARQFVEENISDEGLSVEQFASGMALSREQLYRKLHALTNLSPSAFIRTIRLQRAHALLRVKSGTVSEIAHSVGFGNLSHFSKAFKEEFGTLPSELGKE